MRTSTSTATLQVAWAGEVAYDVALDWQDRLVAARQADAIDDVLLLLTHPPVYTAGRHADLHSNLTGARPDIPVTRIDRGGDVTYHGPGQVVAYPIVRLGRRGGSKAYVTALEAALISTAAHFGVTAHRRPGHPGVWVGGAGRRWDKLAAIGVRITRGVSKHGVALNVAPDLDHYAGIIPCGIVDGGVTSLAALGVDTTVEVAQDRLGVEIAAALERIPTQVAASEFPTG